MKRLSMALTPALMTSALLGSGVASHAQTNLLSLVGDIPAFLGRGDTFTLQLRGDTPGDIKATTFQSVFRFDPTKMTVNFTVNSAIKTSETVNNSLRTVSVSSGAYAGLNVFSQDTYGLSSSTNGLDLNDTLLGTYDIHILNNPTWGIADIGLSNGVITDFNLANNRKSLITAAGTTGTTFGGGDLRPGAYRIFLMPAPSSLAVFAMGGIAPVFALMRRSRRKC